LFSYFAGVFIHACRNVNRHIAALEADKAIFEALIAPLIRYASAIEVKSRDVVMSEDPDSEIIVVQKIVKKSRFSK
jgi:hypothetical protein